MSDITEDSMAIVEQLHDMQSTVSIKNLGSKAEKTIFLGSKNVANMVDAAHDHFTISHNPSDDDKKKVKGIFAKSLRTTSALLGQINEMNQTLLTKEMKLVKAALVFALSRQKKILKEL